MSINWPGDQSGNPGHHFGSPKKGALVLFIVQHGELPL
jgi:hypothetical protein